MYCALHAFNLLWQLNECTVLLSFIRLLSKFPTVAGVTNDALSPSFGNEKESSEEKAELTKASKILLKQIDYG